MKCRSCVTVLRRILHLLMTSLLISLICWPATGLTEDENGQATRTKETGLDRRYGPNSSIGTLRTTGIRKTVTITVIVITVLFIVGLVVVCCYLMKKKRRQRQNRNLMPPPEVAPMGQPYPYDPSQSQPYSYYPQQHQPYSYDPQQQFGWTQSTGSPSMSNEYQGQIPPSLPTGDQSRPVQLQGQPFIEQSNGQPKPFPIPSTKQK